VLFGANAGTGKRAHRKREGIEARDCGVIFFIFSPPKWNVHRSISAI
jgi:hypothetical protein